MMNMLPRSILLIDGNKKERLPIAMMLSRFGHQVRMVTHGKEAQKCIAEEGFDLIIVNDELADMTGLHFLGQYNKVCNSRVLFLSAKGSVDEFVQVVDLGAFEYVRKPISPVQFAVIVCDFFIENIKGYQLECRAIS
jgi:two-component system response regulator (stage 0 sporulation protein F)